MNTALTALKKFLQNPTSENRQTLAETMPRMDDGYLNLLKGRDEEAWAKFLFMLDNDDLFEFREISPFSKKPIPATLLGEFPEAENNTEELPPIDFGALH